MSAGGAGYQPALTLSAPLVPILPRMSSWPSSPAGHVAMPPRQALPATLQPLCSPADGPSHTGPSNLEVLERGLDQLRIRWMAASGPVTGYRVQRVPLTGLGQPVVAERQEVSVPTCLLRGGGGPQWPRA